jgi:2-iminobutanoate/2-iminopropanoate deaminase
MKDFINTRKAPKPLGQYSQAVKAGKFLFVSGQVAIDPRDGEIVDGAVAEQTVQIMENIKAILQAARYTLNDVVISYVYLSSMEQFREFNNIYGRYFEQRFPARVTGGIELVPKALVEISVIAYRERTLPRLPARA